MAQDFPCTDAEQRARLIDSLEGAMASQGFDLYALAGKVRAFVETNMPLLVACESRQTLESKFAEVAVNDAALMENFILLFAVLPGLLKVAVDDSIRKQAESLPRSPGPRVRVDPDLSRNIIACVSDLNGRGASMSGAQMRAAQRFGVSKRTVQRVWQRRSALAEQPFQTLDDAVRFLQS